MSTKSTVAYGPDFHLYREIFDEENIFLEVSNAHFEASPGRVVVAVPLAVWEFSRRFSAIDLDAADQSDKELLQKAEAIVDERLHEYAAAKTEREKAMISGFGLLIYGSADEPRETQLATVKVHLEEERARQRTVKDALEHLEELNGRR